MRAAPPGPINGADYAGDDYNVTNWDTPKSGAANNYEVRLPPSAPRAVFPGTLP